MLSFLIQDIIICRIPIAVMIIERIFPCSGICHPALAHHLTGSFIADQMAGCDFMDSEIKQQANHCRQRFAHVTLVPVLSADRITDFDRMFIVIHLAALEDLADHFFRILADDGQKVSFLPSKPL